MSQQLQAADQIVESIHELTEANRRGRDVEVEQRLVTLRAQAYEAMDAPRSPEPWPASYPDRFVGVVGPPEIEADALDSELLGSALEHHGCLLVRGLFPAPRVAQLVDNIDQTMAALKAVMDGATLDRRSPWFAPFRAGDNDLGGGGRFWAAAGGTVWAAESPRSFFDLIDTFDEIGLRELLNEYFQEPPVLSVVKTSLRRLPPDAPGGWHQDAYVYGLDTRTVNVWTALSACGSGPSPGLDVIPRKLRALAEDLPPPPPLVEVSRETIERLHDETPICRPEFEPGDSLLFDSLLLHQTGTGSGFSTHRYGIESWFFARSTCPTEWVPLYY